MELLNINVHFFILFSTQIVILIFILFVSNLVQGIFFKDHPSKLSYSVLVIWSILLSILHFCDFFELMNVPLILIGSVLISILLLYFYTRAGNQFRDLVKNVRNRYLIPLLVWSAFVFMLIYPFLLMPKGAEVTGYFISNDSVMHSLMMEGFEKTRERVFFPDYYNESYPRGIHSYGFFLNEIVSEEIQLLPITVTIISYSLLIFVLFDIKVYRQTSFINKMIFACLIASPFLILATIYHLFLPQIAVIPLVMILVIRWLDYKRKTSLIELIFDGFIIIAILNIYGVFGLSIVGIAMILRVFTIIVRPSAVEKTRGYLLLNFKILYENKLLAILTVILFILFLVPGVSSSVNILLAQTSNEIGSDLLESNGNLPDGFLETYHITGIWHPDLTYRDRLVGDYSGYAYLLLFTLCIELYFVYGLKNRGVFRSALLVGFVCLASILIFYNSYIHFKYLTYLVVALILAFSVGLLEFQTTRKRKLMSVVISIIFIISAAYINYHSVQLIPVKYRHEFDMLESITDSYFLDDNKTLFLTKDDWIQIYIDNENDYVPLTQYIPTPIPKYEELGEIIIDRGYKEPIEEFLSENGYPNPFLDETCNVNISDRYFVHTVGCE